MIVGHYASALVAKRQEPRLPLWVYLSAAMSLDAVMIGLVFGGVEQLEPGNPEAPKLHEMMIDMTYSHDLLPVALWTLLAAGTAFLGTRSLSASLWIGALVGGHMVCDLLVGFYHFVWGPESPRLGLGLYTNGPLAALALELLFSLVCTWWFLRGTGASRGLQIALYGVMVLGCAVLLPYAL